MATNFVIIDEQPIVLEGIRNQIAQIYPDAEFLYLGSSISDAFSHAKRAKIHCVVIDPKLSNEKNEATAISKLRALKAPIFVMSQENSGAAVSTNFSAGATGFFPKCASLYELRGALGTVMSGGVYISPMVSQSLAASQRLHVRLSEREKTALVLYTSGLTMHQVALSMGIAASTANEYIDRARAKFREIGKVARTKVELRRLAIEEGLLVNA